MANKKLGKGLNAIFGDEIDNFIGDITNGEAQVKGEPFKLSIKEIRPNPYQPRKKFDEAALQELAESIKLNGVFEPIIVRKSLSGYELVAGERRLRASKLAGKKDIPAITVEFDDKQMMEVSLLENIQRSDLTPIEEAQAYEQLIKKLGYTQEELSKRVGKSRENITNLLGLLKLPKEIQKLVSDSKLTYTQARTLKAIEDENAMIELANRVIKEGISVRELEKLVKAQTSKKPRQVKLPIPKDPYIEDVRRKLEKKLSTSVEIGKKNITISFTNVDDLNRILETLGVIDD